MFQVLDWLQQISWKEVREWLSPLIAFAAVCWAIHESREKRRETMARADDAKKYTKALETVIQYGQFVQHLEGVDKRVGSVADQLSQITGKTAEIATTTSEIAQLAARQTDEALKSLANVSGAAMKVAEQLTEIGRTALRAQRDAVRAHKNLVGEITSDHGWGLEFPEYEVSEPTRQDVDSALRERLLEWLAQAQSSGASIEAEPFITKYAQGYGLAKVVNELQRMKRDHLITISTPLSPRSIVVVVKKPGSA